MRVRLLLVEESKSIRHQVLPLEGLVLLYGANSSGKTSLLEAISAILGEWKSVRSDPADPDSYFGIAGKVWFDLPGASTGSTPDAELLRALIRGERGDGKTWEWLDGDAEELLRDATAAEACEYLVERLVEAGAAGPLEERRLLAEQAFDSLTFLADYLQCWIYVDGSRLPNSGRAAAAHVASAVGHPGDALWRLARAVVDGKLFELATVVVPFASTDPVVNSWPAILRLDAEPDSLKGELRQDLANLHNKVWDLVTEPDLTPGSDDPGGHDVVLDEFPMWTTAYDSVYTIDPWLEALDERAGREGDVVWSRFSRYYQHDWYRVRRSLLATVRVIAETANDIAPRFVADQGAIEIEILPVAAWASEPDRVRVVFVEDSDGQRRDIGVLGAGTARWVAAAVRLACQRLRTADRLVVDPAGVPVVDPREANRIIRQARSNPLEQSCFRFKPVHTDAIYLVDEPEAHLHPRAVASVAQWLVELAASASAVVVATHNTTILNAPSEAATAVLVVSGSDGTELRTVTGDLSTALERIAEELGLSRGELLLLTRVGLFVEGPHDVAVLEEWFGADLHAAGVRLFPLHGIDNVNALVDSEVISALQVKMAVLADNTDARRIQRGGQPGSREERQVSRLLAEARLARRPIKVFGLDQPDIVFYLDDAICKAKARDFPGWRKANNAWKAAGQPSDFKRWITDKYQLQLTRKSVRALARACKDEAKIHPEVAQVVQEVLAYTTR